MNNDQIQHFAIFLQTRGYKESTIRQYCKAINEFLTNWKTVIPSELYEHINNSLFSIKGELTSSVYFNLRAALNQWFLMKADITVKDYRFSIKKECKFESILFDFYIYSTEFKKITVLSAKAECQHICGFLDYIGNSFNNSLANIEAKHVRDYVCTNLSLLKNSSKGRYVTSLRNFFRFLQYKGICVNQSILALPLTTADWNKGNIPITLTEDEEQKLRIHYLNDNKRDKLNRVIILMMLNLGLRCSEIPTLKLSDILWHTGTIKINSTKTKRARELPIPEELGIALEDYIIKFRPCTGDEHLFLTYSDISQNKPISREGVRRVVRQAFKMEGIRGWWKGTHSLRRTAASHIHNSGSGLKITADILGHESLDSTTHYVKVDCKTLGRASASWPVGDSNENK